MWPPEVVGVDEVTVRVLGALAAWSNGAAPPHHLLIGPKGCGRTFLSCALAESAGAVSLRATDDWRVALATLKDERGRLVVIDDIQAFDAAFAQDLCKLVREGGHRILATRSPAGASQRVSRIVERELGRDLVSLSLPSWADRAGDVRELTRLAAVARGVSLTAIELADLGQVIRELPFADGWHGVGRFLAELFAGGQPVLGSVAISAAYSRGVRSGQVEALPVILVEGKTDELYLRWARRVCERSEAVEVEACGAASRIPQRAAALTNSGVPCVALFDSDEVGSDQHKQLKEWKYASMTLPVEAFSLRGAEDHVRCVVEIEDMLPLELVKEFFRVRPDRLPEIVIAMPRSSKERWVVHKDDKLALAEWVCETQTVASARSLAAVYDRLLGLLVKQPPDAR